MIKVSHQSPKQLLQTSRYYNDYDYALVHMFEQDEQYYQFFKTSLQLNRQVLLDNSIFELGVSFNSEAFATWIKELRPTYYIIPDVLDDMQNTVVKIKQWIGTYNELPGKKIGVLQGSTIDELLTCYDEIVEYVDKIAISFNSTPFASEDKVLQAMNRITFVNILQENRIITKPIHLLGVSVPQQMYAYRNKSFIQSVDTSNPIVHGCIGVRYDECNGLDIKIPTKLVDIYYNDFSCDDLCNVYYNVSKFKQYLGR